MKHSILAKNFYKSADTVSVKQTVTAKIERLINKQFKKS